PLTDAIRAVEACEPTPGRMELIADADGVAFINDSYKAPYWSLDAVFEFMRVARAARKWIVLGKISHHRLKSRQLYRRVAERALACCDRVVFVGPSAHHAPDSGGRVRAFAHVREADRFLRSELRRGDLVLVKGENIANHAARLFLSRMHGVTCWREDCGLAIDCRRCRMLARGSASST
ncbi:MAG TPA: cyanophycin synthetase, partial [Gammaproteobacteria bacterium]|nr:cyanophycin synthetase [Gammaproteobacteria bacterium]